jgi:hypothetical protein
VRTEIQSRRLEFQILTSPWVDAPNMDLETLVAQFHDHTLPRESWSHHAHLGLALWALKRFEFEAALAHLQVEITAYNRSVGVENGPFSGFHVTITHFFLQAVQHSLLQMEVEDLDEQWSKLTEIWGEKNVIFRYYSRRHLFSPSTRAHFAPPDLRPLDF